MAESQVAQDALLASFVALATHATVFSADPGRTGSATPEIALLRVALTWGAPVSVGAARTRTAVAVIPLPAGVTVTHGGACSSSLVGSATVLDSGTTTNYATVAPSNYTLTIVRSEP